MSAVFCLMGCAEGPGPESARGEWVECCGMFWNFARSEDLRYCWCPEDVVCEPCPDPTDVSVASDAGP